MTKMHKNLITLLLSTLLSFLLLYSLIFIKTYFENQENLRHVLFKTIEGVDFHKKYSEKMHHIRTPDFESFDKNIEDLLFSNINSFLPDNKNILFQGDSWMEQINLQYKNSKKRLTQFAKKNNYGIINAGTTSFSPSLMMTQYQALENDFNIKPNIVVSYIDQTDIGDEICRYKNLRILDQKNNLIAVKNEFYTRRIYDYAQNYRWSEIILSKDSKIEKKIKFTNFFIKFKVLRLKNKIINIKNFGWSNRENNKCPFNKITEHLKKIDPNDLVYFESILNDYINFLVKKDYLNKIIFVTFPHKNHMISSSNKEYYSVNISNILEKAIANKKKIYHLDFSKLFLEKKIQFNQNMYLDNDPGSHLKEKFHTEIFLEKIINEIKK